MLTLKNISYIHTNGDLQFDHVNFTLLPNTKSGLIGLNGSGKSLLLQIMAGKIAPASGHVERRLLPYYIPQRIESLLSLTVAEAIGIAKKLTALHSILKGQTDDIFFTQLENDWHLEERCCEAFAHWDIGSVTLHQRMQTLSGGERMKVMLAGIQINQTGLVLLDEPTNHLDQETREKVYMYARETSDTLLVVSHDLTLLNLLTPIYELGEQGLKTFGGSYDFYLEQKQLHLTALQQDIQDQEKSLRKIKAKEKEVKERRQRLDARGKGKQQKSGLPKIMMNTLRNQAEASTARLKDIHTEKVDTTKTSLQALRQQLPQLDQIKIDLAYTNSLRTKVLIDAYGINFQYETRPVWAKPLTFKILTGSRIHVKGKNGSGKTTALKIMLGDLEPDHGTVVRRPFRHVYLDQDYSLLGDDLSIYDQAQQFNEMFLPEYEIKIRLNRFLFSKNNWGKKCHSLSGGERMRLLLCCLTIREQAPDLIVLDEPTNNLDSQNTRVLGAAIRHYRGSLLVVSHDQSFIEEIGLNDELRIE